MDADLAGGDAASFGARSAVLRFLQLLAGWVVFGGSSVLAEAVFGRSGRGRFGGSCFKGVVLSVIFGKPPQLISRSIILLGCLGCDGFGWERIHHFSGRKLLHRFCAMERLPRVWRIFTRA